MGLGEAEASSPHRCLGLKTPGLVDSHVTEADFSVRLRGLV